MSFSSCSKFKKFSISTLLAIPFISTPVIAVEKGDILLDVRILNISPDVGSNQIMDSNGDPFLPPAGIDVDDGYSLGLDITYMVTNNFGVELMLDTTSKHDITGTGNLDGLNIGDVTVLPPSVIAVWHFMPSNNIRPYVGAGVNYTFFLSENTTSDLDAALGGNTGLDVDDTFSLIAQAGVNIDISKKWYLTFDAKYIDLDTSATIKVDGVKTATVDFDLNPLILGVGVGTRF
jgi:outer membrane protein